MTDPTPSPTADRALTRVLDVVAVNHLLGLSRAVGFITDAEVAAHMPAARAIHADAMERDPHPVDATLPADAHEWVAQRIAINLVARARGYRVERVIADQEAARRGREQPPEPPTRLRPLPVTADPY